jgi:hypothetical protein
MLMMRLADVGMETRHEILSKFLDPGGLPLLTPVFAIWMSLANKPYNGVLFNIHIPVVLGAGGVTYNEILQASRSMELPAILIAWISGADLGAALLFVAGAVMNAG